MIDFNDPEGWGFCPWCAFQVARDPEAGTLLDHERQTGDREKVTCYGSGRVGGIQPAPEAKPNPSPGELDVRKVEGNYEPMDTDPRHPRAVAASFLASAIASGPPPAFLARFGDLAEDANVVHGPEPEMNHDGGDDGDTD